MFKILILPHDKWSKSVIDIDLLYSRYNSIKKRCCTLYGFLFKHFVLLEVQVKLIILLELGISQTVRLN